MYPSGKFGANAAWLRLQVLTHNLLETFKAAALDQSQRHARPKRRVRFTVFTPCGEPDAAGGAGPAGSGDRPLDASDPRTAMGAGMTLAHRHGPRPRLRYPAAACALSGSICAQAPATPPEVTAMLPLGP